MTAILIIFALLLLFRHTIARLLGRLIVWLTVRRVRKQMGMPPGGDASARRRGKQQRQTRTARTSTGHIIPPEYAEDVEFVEIKEFSATTIADSDGKHTRTDYHESQVSDAEWEEVKR